MSRHPLRSAAAMALVGRAWRSAENSAKATSCRAWAHGHAGQWTQRELFSSQGPSSPASSDFLRKSESAAYDGPGKTTVTILNDTINERILVDSISVRGFRMSNKMLAFGPVAVFPNTVLSWRVVDFLSVTERTLELFTLLEPRPEVVVLGYGDILHTPVPKKTTVLADDRLRLDKEEEIKKALERRQAVTNHVAKLSLLMRAKKINLECMATEDAVATYNYLCSEDRLVAAALIPPNRVTLLSLDTQATNRLEHTDLDP